MKKLALLLMIYGIVSTTTYAQLRKIPSKVTDALKAKFPDASGVEWKDKVTNFEATFELNSVKYQSTFNSKGEWQSTEKFISETELPAEVKDGLAKSKYNSSDWEKKSFVWVDSKKDGERYRIFVEKNVVNKRYLYFNKSGQLDKETLSL